MDTTQNVFTVFPKLPPELRNRIWGFAANNEPRTLDIWTDFKRCEVGSTTFYTQEYSMQLAKPLVPSILQTSQESRIEALKHYTLEYRTHMSLRELGITVIIAARTYVNYACDVLIPRGFWNIVAFSDFTDRVMRAGLVHLAMDTEGSFWQSNVKDYCTHGTWVLNGVQELMLYNSKDDSIWKGSAYLDKFRKHYKGGPKLLELVDLEAEPSQDVIDVQKFILQSFEKIEGNEQKLEKDEEEAQTPIRRIPRYLDDCPKTESEELRRPRLRAKKLVVKPIYTEN